MTSAAPKPTAEPPAAAAETRGPGRPPSRGRLRYTGNTWRADKLVADMERAGVRPQVLADTLGVSSQAVSNWRREGTIASEYFPKLARLLGGTTDEYCAREEAEGADAAHISNRYRFVPIRPLMHAAAPWGAAARAAVEGARRMLSSARTDLTGRAFAVEVPEGVIGPTGSAGGGCAVVDPGRVPVSGDVVLVNSKKFGPRLRRYVETDGRALAMPLAHGSPDGFGGEIGSAEFQLLGLCCEWHPSPVIVSPGPRELSPRG